MSSIRHSLVLALLLLAIFGSTACQRETSKEKKDDDRSNLPQYVAWLEVQRGDGLSWRAGTLLEWSSSSPPPYDGTAAILNPPGGEIYASALYLGRNKDADLWQITIKPPPQDSTEPVVSEIEYKNEFISIWSDANHEVFLLPPDKKPRPGQPLERPDPLDDFSLPR